MNSHTHSYNDNLVILNIYSPLHPAGRTTTVLGLIRLMGPVVARSAAAGSGVATVGTEPGTINPDAPPRSAPAFRLPQLFSLPGTPAFASVAVPAGLEPQRPWKPAWLPFPAIPSPDHYPSTRSFATCSLPSLSTPHDVHRLQFWYHEHCCKALYPFWRSGSLPIDHG